MDANVAEQVKDVLDHVAEKLAVPVGHLWEVLVRQQVVEGWMGVGYWIVFAAALIVMVYLSPRMYKWAESLTDGYDGHPGGYFAVIVPSVVLVILFLVSTICLGDDITKIVNPEYHALNEVLGLVGRR